MGKMIKYEFKATWKFMLIVFLCACVISAGLFVISQMDTDELVPMTSDSGIVVGYVSESWLYSMTGSVFLFMASIVLVICFCIIRFKKVLTSEEGYLVKTLPVGEGSIILSKAITFFAYAIPIVGLTFVSFFCLIIHGIDGVFPGLPEEITAAASNFNLTGEHIANSALSLANALASGTIELFSLYAAMAIGFSFNRHKGLWSFAALIAIAAVTEPAAEILTPIRNLIYHFTPMQFEDIIRLITSIAIAVILYFVTYYFMKKRPCVE